jgi:hypothetical protein
MLMRRYERHARVVVEFVGLPGSGKTTVCRRVEALMTEAGVAVSTVGEFVAWSARLGKPFKLWLMLRAPLRTLCYLVRGVRFWLSLDPRVPGNLRRVLLAPMISLCLEHFLESESEALVLLDQADVQGVWSIGALAQAWGSRPLSGLLRSSTPNISRMYACVAVDPAFASGNIAVRGDGASRFDAMALPQTEEALKRAAPLMEQIVDWLKAHHGNVLVLDAAADVEAKAGEVARRVRNLYKLRGLPA